MSYDFYAEIDTGGEEPHHIEPYFDDHHPGLAGAEMAGNYLMSGGRCGNYTSNVSPIWSKCLTAAATENELTALAGKYDRDLKERMGARGHEIEVRADSICLADLDGEPMGLIGPLLERVKWGLDNIDELREMNPPNGWGNAAGAVEYLWDIQRFCEQHPKATLYLSH